MAVSPRVASLSQLAMVSSATQGASPSVPSNTRMRADVTWCIGSSETSEERVARPPMASPTNFTVSCVPSPATGSATSCSLPQAVASSDESTRV